MTTAEQIAAFALGTSYDDFADQAEGGPVQQRLKLSVLDTMGCAIGALDGEPVRWIRALNDELGGREQCSLIGGGPTANDRATLDNTALVPYVDFMASCPLLAPDLPC